MSERIDKRIAAVLAKVPRGAHGGALCAAADELLAAGDVDGALECFDRALQADVKSARAWTGRATVLAHRNRFGEALGCISRALDERAAYAPAVVLKAEVLVRAGRRPEALACCHEALAADRSRRPLGSSRALCGGARVRRRRRRVVRQRPGARGHSRRVVPAGGALHAAGESSKAPRTTSLAPSRLTPVTSTLGTGSRAHTSSSGRPRT